MIHNTIFDQYCIKPSYCFFTWGVVVSSNLNENALPRKLYWRDYIKYEANPNWIGSLIFVSLCLYLSAISESENISLNNFPLPLAEMKIGVNCLKWLQYFSFDNWLFWWKNNLRLGDYENTWMIQWNHNLVLTSFFTL